MNLFANSPGRKFRFLWLALLSLCSISACAAEITIQLPPETQSFKQAAGAELANAQCLICHSVEYVTTQPPMPRTLWKSSVQKMQQKYGAQIPDAQVEPLVDYLVNNYGVRSNGVAAAASPVSVTTTSGNPDRLDGPQVALKYGCLGCHNASTKLVGPAYRDIAAKYKEDAEARAKVAEQVHKGGSGKWGPILMPPFPQVSDAELKVLTEWILGLD